MERAKLVHAWRAQRAKMAQMHASPAALRPFPNRPLTIGFYLSTDELGYPDLKREASRLDWFVPAWINLQGRQMAGAQRRQAGARSHCPYKTEHGDPAAGAECVERGVERARHGGAARRSVAAPHPASAALPATSPPTNSRARWLISKGLPQSAYPDLATFLAELTQAFAPHDWIIVVAAPFDDDNWPYADYAKIVDYTLLMAYDEHDDTERRGQHRRAGLVRGKSRQAHAQCCPPTPPSSASAITAMTGPRAAPQPMSFQDAMIAARDSQARIALRSTDHQQSAFLLSRTITASMMSGSWTAVTAFNQIHAADPYQPAGYALWRLGSEDPSIMARAGPALRCARAAQPAQHPDQSRMSISTARAKSCGWKAIRRSARARSTIDKRHRRHQRRKL